MSMYATILNSDFDPLTDGVEVETDADFEALETKAAYLASGGTKCCIHWSRDSDGQTAYWGPKGATLKPHWYYKPGTHGGPGRGQGRKPADGATGLKHRNISIDAESDAIAHRAGRDRSSGIREALRFWATHHAEE